MQDLSKFTEGKSSSKNSQVLIKKTIVTFKSIFVLFNLLLETEPIEDITYVPVMDSMNLNAI